MDIQTSNRILDEIALTVGMRLIDMGVTLRENDVQILATQRDRDAGVDRAIALGHLTIDTGDLPTMTDAIAAQDDRIRSIMSMTAPRDSAFAVVQRKDLADAKFRRQLLDCYVRNDRNGMASAYAGIMDVHARRL